MRPFVQTARILLASLFAFIAVLPNRAIAQNAAAVKLDRVTYGPVATGREDPDELWATQKPDSILGKIRKLDGQELVFIDQSGKSIRLASNRVLDVSIGWDSSAASAIELLENRKYREAIPALQAVLEEGLPPWKSQFLVNGLVRAAHALDRPRVAGIVFLQYQAPNDPPDLLFGDLPLAWTSQEPDRLLREQASKWLKGSTEIEQLLGASWSLSGPDRDAAKQTLLRLESSSSKVIADLATCQGWRFTAPPQTMSELNKWLRFRDSLIRPLQLGPTEFIAERLMRIGQKDLAIGQWMRIATIHSHRYDRVAKALGAAKTILERDGLSNEAERIAEWIKDNEG